MNITKPFLLSSFLLISGYGSDNFKANVEFIENKKTICEIKSSELIKLALENHPSIKMNQSVYESSKKQVEISKWSYYPSPSVDYSYKNSDKHQTMIRLEQPLWTGGKLDGELNKSKNKENEALFLLEEKKYQLIKNFAEVYKKYLINSEKLKVLNQHQEKLEELKKLVNTMVKAGELSNADNNNINAILANLKTEIVLSKANLKASKLSLELLVDNQIKCDIKNDLEIPQNNQLDVDIIVSLLKENHPSLNALDNKIKYTLDDVELAKSNFFPNLVVRAEHKKGSLYDDSSDENENLIYFNFNLSLGAGLSNLSNLEKMKIEVAKVKNEKIVKEQELLDTLMQDYTNYVMANTNVTIIGNDLKYATKVYESNSRLFVSNKKSWLDVVSSLNELKSKKIKFIETINEKNILEYKLFLDSGKVNLNNGEVSGI